MKGGHCIAYGGGYRCQTVGCDKHAMKGGGHVWLKEESGGDRESSPYK